MGVDLSVAAVPGEFEPLVVGLVAFRSWREVKIRIGDLRSDEGGSLPASVIDVRVVRVLTLPVDSRPVSMGEKRCQRKPFVLMPEDRLKLGPAEPGWIWLTVAVPKNARPGRYRGSIKFSGDDGEIAALPFVVRVHPFSLAVPPIEYVMLYETSLTELRKAKTSSDRAGVMDRAAAIYRDLYDHGMTAVSPVEIPDFERDGDGRPAFPVVRAALELARKQGLTGTPVINIAPLARTEKPSHSWNYKEHRPDIHPGQVTQYVETVMKWARAAGWKTVAFSPIDEPDISERTKIGEAVLKAAKQVEGALTFVAGTPKQIAPLFPWVDIADLRASRYTLRDHDRLRRAGRRVWLYDNWIVLGTTPIETRFVAGLYAWRAGLDGVTAWTYPLTDQRAIDWETGWRPPVIGADGRPVSTTVWEAFREGVDDGRYVFTLERTIERARSSGLDRDSEAAEETLRQVSKRIAPAVRWYASGKKEGRRMGGIGGEDLDWSRDQLANAIEILSGKLGGQIPRGVRDLR
jgi:hypothetical protein